MHKRLCSFPAPPRSLPKSGQRCRDRPVGHRSEEATVLGEQRHPEVPEAPEHDGPDLPVHVLLHRPHGGAASATARKKRIPRRCLAARSESAGSRRPGSNGKAVDALAEVPWGKAAARPEAIAEALRTGKYDAVLLTHNETSTGVMNPLSRRSRPWSGTFPDVFLFVDAVSSMGAVDIDFDGSGARRPAGRASRRPSRFLPASR